MHLIDLHILILDGHRLCGLNGFHGFLSQFLGVHKITPWGIKSLIHAPRREELAAARVSEDQSL